MQVSICIKATIDRYQTSMYSAPIEKTDEDQVWLLVDFNECDWSYDVTEDFIDGEDQHGHFSHPIQTLSKATGFWEGYKIINAEECVNRYLEFI